MVEAIPIPLLYAQGNSDQIKAYDAHVSNLKTFLRDVSFFYSYDFSLTMSQQRLATFVPGKPSMYQWEAAEERFFWNMVVAVPFCREGLERFLVTVVDGFVVSHTMSLQGQNVRLTLVTRRSRHRAGTRFLTRGIDPGGNVANYAETEQILELLDSGTLHSWVTVRGSIPVFWSQLGPERIPPPVVNHTVFSAESFQKHLQDLESQYGKGLTLINLIDQSGKEAHLGEAYEMAVRLHAGPNVRYVSVDFHVLTKGDRYENLSKLMDALADDLTAELWFSKNAQGPITMQRAVSRTNCIDCLDRTNVVQTMLGRFVLNHQLYLNNLASPDVPMSQEFVMLFNGMWTDNADAISHRYTGAAAMKTDFTRTGVRGLRGQLQDGITAAERFIEQTLRDPVKQDATNIFLGKYYSRRIPSLGPAVAAAQDVLRVRAYKRSTWKYGVEYPVAFEVNGTDILMFDWEGQKVRFFPISTLVSISPSALEGAVVTFVFDISVSPKVLRFQNAAVREKIIQRVLQLRPPAPVLMPDAAAASQPIRFFAGYVNMVGVGAMKDVSLWIPSDRDVYILSVANAIFPSPDQFVFFGAQYFFFQALRFLGPNFICLNSSESATGDGTLVVVRKDVASRFSQAELKPVTRTVRVSSDPSWLKRMAHASLAHREVARSKSRSRLEAESPRRRATVDIQKEVTQVGCSCTFSVDGGPLMQVVNIWDPTSRVPDTHVNDVVLACGLFSAEEPGSQVISRGLEPQDGSIVFHGYTRHPADPSLVSYVSGDVIKVPCDALGFSFEEGASCEICGSISSQTKACFSCAAKVCHDCRTVAPNTENLERLCRRCWSSTLRGDGDAAKEFAAVSASTDEREVSAVDVTSASGSQSTLEKMRASMLNKDGPAKKSGVFRLVSSAEMEEIPKELLSPRAEEDRDISCTCLRASFNVSSTSFIRDVLPHAEANATTLQLVDLQVGEWTSSTSPSRLRLEMTSPCLVEDRVSTEISDSGKWTSLTMHPWTVQGLARDSLFVNLTGISGSSSFGGFFSSITGTSQALADARIPLWPLSGDGKFRVPLFAAGSVQEVSSKDLFGYLSGRVVLVKKGSDDDDDSKHAAVVGALP